MNSTEQEWSRKRVIWLQWVFGNAPLSMASRVVGGHLAMRMRPDQPYAWPNIKTMAKTLDLSPRHVQRSMIALERAGLLHVKRARGHGNEYYLKLPSED